MRIAYGKDKNRCASDSTHKQHFDWSSFLVLLLADQSNLAPSFSQLQIGREVASAATLGDGKKI